MPLVLLTLLPIAIASKPSIGEIHRRVSPALVAESHRAEGPGHVRAVLRLCDLYAQARGHDRYARSRTLQGDAAQMRRRLSDVADRLESQLGRLEIPRPEPAAKNERTLAASGQYSSGGARPPSSRLRTPSAGAGGAAVPDAGWWLVDLIRRTISPDFWDTAGGPGTIRYFSFRRALVIRGTTEVHDQTRRLLEALRGQ